MSLAAQPDLMVTFFLLSGKSLIMSASMYHGGIIWANLDPVPSTRRRRKFSSMHGQFFYICGRLRRKKIKTTRFSVERNGANYQQLLRHPYPDVFFRCRSAPPAHIHAQYQGQQAQFAIDSGELLAGALPRAQTRLVQAWI